MAEQSEHNPSLMFEGPCYPRSSDCQARFTLGDATVKSERRGRPDSKTAHPLQSPHAVDRRRELERRLEIESAGSWTGPGAGCAATVLVIG
mmetsp:Transcript_19864/g.44848  ORF Transcript_19864/g.44848 Transcript_19864/m.44848 type:complete len:91 (+) Transcript_19864:1410-1682(+)